MAAAMLRKSVGELPAGRWAVGVSGGADSVALLLLLCERSDLVLHIVHLDHQTREGESAFDAEFVKDLAEKFRLPCTIEKRSVIEMSLADPPRNISDRYRRARFALFQRIAADQQLQGVVLAHHGDDQAETVLMRVLRGASPANLAGMQAMSVVNDLRIARPLLDVFSQDLRAFLLARGQDWREDSSNQSDRYMRNRLRIWLSDRPRMRDELLRLERASRGARKWLDLSAPMLGETFSIASLHNVPMSLARHSAERWLVGRGAPPREVNAETCERLIRMSIDVATGARHHFPGGLLVRRKSGMISVEPDQ
jgi:tRNA(Ile)-lysidine synthetase-like protein